MEEDLATVEIMVRADYTPPIVSGHSSRKRVRPSSYKTSTARGRPTGQRPRRGVTCLNASNDGRLNRSLPTAGKSEIKSDADLVKT